MITALLALNYTLFMQQPSVMPPRRVFTSAPKLDEEARRRSEAATQQLMQNYNGQPNVGIKLMSKMGYGVAGELCSVWHVTVYHTVTSHQLPHGFGNQPLLKVVSCTLSIPACGSMIWALGKQNCEQNTTQACWTIQTHVSQASEAQRI